MFLKFNSIQYNIILDVFKEYQVDHWLCELKYKTNNNIFFSIRNSVTK